MNFLRSLLLFSLGVVAARADESGPAIANPPSGPSAPPAPSSAIAGPFLSPPMPSKSTVVDSAEMVPPVAQADPPPAQPAPAPESNGSPATENVTINLIQLMVKRGLISKGDASALVSQAKEEAANAHPHGTPPPPTAADSDGMLQTPASAPAGGGGEDSVAVTYVPDVVRNQIRDEVTADVLQQAHDEGLVTKSDVPDWVHRFRITGDIRTRFEDDLFPDGNALGQFVNYNQINTGSPFNINSSPYLPPTYNTDQDRERLRLRARIGADIELGQGWTSGIRLGTGSDDQPVSENQTLGGVSSSTQNQGGDFSKYQIWLDRAFIRYEWGLSPKDSLSASVGRFDNPFFGTSMIWADDLAFDGIMLRGQHQIEDGLTPFGVAGLFPVYNTDLNFGTGSTDAGQGYKSEDKWLYAAQVGLDWRINKEFNFKGAVAFYDFDNIEGKVSSPIDQDVFTTVGSGYQGNTDDSRPSFAQHGNTYIALRDVTPGVLPPTTSPDYQYYGLATAFRELALTGQLDYSHFDPFHISLLGEFVDNTAFDRSAIENNGPASDPGPQNNNDGSTFVGGNMGGNVRVTVGKVALENLWDWNMSFTYRYIESDAVVDGFTDADFGAPLYGTNLQGYIIGGNLALSSNVWVGLRFMSADSIAGPTFHSDLVQLDLNAKF
jgi:hypothetical protein